MFNDKKNKSAKKKSAYSTKISDFIDKLLDSPQRDKKETVEKCNTNPKREESKVDNFMSSIETDSTFFSEKYSSPKQECLERVKLSGLIKSNAREILDCKLQNIMKEAMDVKSSSN